MKRKILFLALSSFSETGGIQQVCRTLAHALFIQVQKTPYKEKKLQMHALYDDLPDTRYIPPYCFQGYSGHKIKFILGCIRNGLQSKTVIISHINLILVAVVIKLINRKAQLILLTHGVEVDRRLSSWKINFINRCASVWAVSHHTSKVLQSRHHIKPHRIDILNNCIDPFFTKPDAFKKPIHLLKKHQIKSTTPVMLSLCRMTSADVDKGYDLVLRSIPDLLLKHPDLQYLMAGQMSYSEKNRLVRLSQKLQLQNQVKMIGFIPQHERIKYYQLADVFVLPSKKEGFGLVFIEAAACGCPIIAGNADGSSDALLNGLLGTLLNPNNTQHLTAAIATQLDRRRTNAQAKIQQDLCLKHFNFQKYCQKVNQLLS